MEAQVIKSLLESFGIPSVLQSNAAPSVHLLTVNGMSAVNIMVLASAAEQARELILKEPPPNPDGETPE
jgi:hypothetical protein